MNRVNKVFIYMIIVVITFLLAVYLFNSNNNKNTGTNNIQKLNKNFDEKQDIIRPETGEIDFNK